MDESELVTAAVVYAYEQGAVRHSPLRFGKAYREHVRTHRPWCRRTVPEAYTRWTETGSIDADTDRLSARREVMGGRGHGQAQCGGAGSAPPAAGA